MVVILKGLVCFGVLVNCSNCRWFHMVSMYSCRDGVY
jgi:hypothetical protein